VPWKNVNATYQWRSQNLVVVEAFERWGMGRAIPYGERYPLPTARDLCPLPKNFSHFFV